VARQPIHETEEKAVRMVMMALVVLVVAVAVVPVVEEVDAVAAAAGAVVAATEVRAATDGPCCAPVQENNHVRVGLERVERVLIEDHCQKLISLHKQLGQVPGWWVPSPRVQCGAHNITR
jgi:hypothetical protein